jgi:hypothetical protein
VTAALAHHPNDYRLHHLKAIATPIGSKGSPYSRRPSARPRCASSGRSRARCVAKRLALGWRC